MDPTELAYLSLADLAEQLRSRELSPVEVTQMILERTEQLEPILNAYITLTADSALEDARRAEKEIMVGRYRGPLHGVPIAVKDFFWTKSVRTTAGSRIFADFVPEEDAAAVGSLRQAGAVITGKTNTPEFGWVFFKEHTYGIPRNPWNRDRSPGISSTGSAIALAAGMAYGALGSDTGGSVRHPAAVNGITGLKPARGRISLYGGIPLCRSLDHAGPMARSVLDCAHLLDALAGYDSRDPSSLHVPVPTIGWAAQLSDSVPPMRIGIPRAYFWDDLASEVEAAAETALSVWRDLGWTVQEIDLPPVPPVATAQRLVVQVEAAASTRQWLEEQSSVIGEEFRTKADPGLGVSAVDYIDALETWQAFGQALEQAFEEVDVLVMPAHSTAALEYGPDGALVNPPPFKSVFGLFNLAGVPAMVIPGGIDSNGVPLGVHLVGPSLREDIVLAAGHAFQQVTDWHLRRPPVSNLTTAST